jgi:hypothetical protein
MIEYGKRFFTGESSILFTNIISLKKDYLSVSLAVSLLSIAITTYINIQIAQFYIKATGKTRALFGITELLNFGYQYYVTVLGLAASLLFIFSSKGNGSNGKKQLAMLLSFAAIAIVYVMVWRLFI